MNIQPELKAALLDVAKSLDDMTPDEKRLAAALLGSTHDLLELLVAWSHNGLGHCWCQHGIGNPMMPDHSSLCTRTRTTVAPFLQLL